jgi:hypothetical protein
MPRAVLPAGLLIGTILFAQALPGAPADPVPDPPKKDVADPPKPAGPGDVAADADLELARHYLDAKRDGDAANTVESILRSNKSSEVKTQALKLLGKIDVPGIVAQAGEALLKAGDSADARKVCSDQLSKYPLSQPLIDCLNRVTQEDQKKSVAKDWSTIAAARNQIADGQRTAAVSALEGIVAQTSDQGVRDEATKVLKEARTRPDRIFIDRLRQPWLYDLSVVTLLLGVLWGVLVGTRKVWWLARSAERTGRRPVRWALLPIPDPPATAGTSTTGAGDAILDALRRVPLEASRKLWTPSRLLLRPLPLQPSEPDVWDGFLFPSEQKLEPLVERLMGLVLSTRKQEVDKLAEAFQTLTFAVGTANPSTIAKFIRALSDWWAVGAPSFGGAALVNRVDTKEEITVRLTCANGPFGSISVLASTPRVIGMDPLGMSADRAVYKLLYRITKPKASAVEVDGHASFRQGWFFCATTWLRRRIPTATKKRARMRLPPRSLTFGWRDRHFRKMTRSYRTRSG